MSETNKNTIWGFYEEKFPTYSDWPNICELHSLVDANEVNSLVENIKELVVALNKCDKYIKRHANASGGWWNDNNCFKFVNNVTVPLLSKYKQDIYE